MNTPDRILEGNKLIAEFMDVEPNENGYYFVDLEGSNDMFSADELCFHNSWDWLMPVIIKCYNIEVQGGDTAQFLYDHKFIAVFGGDMNVIFDNVVDYIKWIKSPATDDDKTKLTVWAINANNLINNPELITLCRETLTHIQDFQHKDEKGAVSVEYVVLDETGNFVCEFYKYLDQYHAEVGNQLLKEASIPEIIRRIVHELQDEWILPDIEVEEGNKVKGH